MAFPKPLRALVALSAVFFMFMIFQMFRSPPSIHKPGSGEERAQDMQTDPMADRKFLYLDFLL